MDEWDKYLYPLIQNIMVGGQLSKLRGDRTRRSGWLDALVSSNHCCVRSSRWYWPDPVLRPVNNHQTHLASKNPSLDALWCWVDADTPASGPTSGHCLTSLSIKWTDRLSLLRLVTLDQRPVSHWTLHSLPIQNPLWMKLTPIDLRAIPELHSAMFDKCAPHLIH
jgi:hypothetical protein